MSTRGFLLRLSSVFSVASVVKFLCLLTFGFGLFLVPWCRGAAPGSEYRGQVTFGGLPLPGATVTASQGSKQITTTTDLQGLFLFPDLENGTWTIEIQMTGFASVKQDVVAGPDAPVRQWELMLLSLKQIRDQIKPLAGARIVSPQATGEPAKSEQSKPTGSETPEKESSPDDQDQLSVDGFLINGSVNNGAASPFAQSFAFGNRRNWRRGLYNGGLGLIFDNSALDARPFSLSGQSAPKPAYNRITGVATFGGSLRIPHLLERGPNVFVAYQWSRSVNATTLSALVPDLADRGGDFSQALNALGQPLQIFNPVTGAPFSGNIIPPGHISPQAQALLSFYPLPGFGGNPRYNYQIPLSTDTHQDALFSRFNHTVNSKNQLYGGVAFESTRTATPNLFGFLDTDDVLGLNTSLNWSHRLGPGLFLNLGYRFSRLATRTHPFWANRQNVSGQAGITGNNQEPLNWGPPTLAFASGIAGLSDARSSFDRNQTSAGSYSVVWNHDLHNFTFGGDFRREQFNHLSQQNPRGTFTFTGTATRGTASGVAVGGSDLADFLLGIPDTSSIAFGNADKYFRESVYDVYFQDDWRIRPEFTLNAGVRWEYGAPITERYGRLVNLDIAPGFSAVEPTVAMNPTGPLTGQMYPNSLLRPDKNALEPRIGFAWRPISGSSLVVRAGYGVYYDTSVYQTLAQQMAQQAPLSKSLSVQNSVACPLTLANGFNSCPATTPNTFAVDPDFRVGYAQIWQVAVQRDLPGSLQLTATYLGIKGTRGMQEFLPNTFPPGAVNPCPACPVGFAYVSTNGNSTREAGQLQLRRRLHSGFTATVQYTYSKSIDDDAALGGQGAVMPTQTFGTATGGTGSGGIQAGLVQSPVTGAGGLAIAQNWLDLAAERSLSAFDQRHLMTATIQYSTGMGLGGRTLMSGRKGTLFKEWTWLTQITVGSGLPQTPIYLAAVPGTGVTGTIRPDYTGAAIYGAPSGLFLNPAAYAEPAAGQWGNAGRDSVTGPGQFALNASMGRTFRLNGRFNVDFRIDSTNFLNHVTYASWDTTVTSTQFGLPAAANAMRSVQTTLRLRY
jgi:Carboxypeptidase regulatory-like domain